MNPERRAQLEASLAEVGEPEPWAPLQRLAGSQATVPSVADVDERARTISTLWGVPYEWAVVQAQDEEIKRQRAEEVRLAWAAAHDVLAERVAVVFDQTIEEVVAAAHRVAARLAEEAAPTIEALRLLAEQLDEDEDKPASRVCPRHGKELRGGICRQCERTRQ